MATTTTDPIFQLLSDRYSEKFFIEQAEQLAKEINETGILVFNDFLNQESINSLQKEASKLKPRAYRSNSSYNVYVQPTDPAYPENSPRNRRFTTTKGCIPDDMIPEDSALRTIYNSDAFRQFLCSIVGADTLYPYADTLSSININYYDPGDALEWHFDNATFTITLLLKKPNKGGVYEYFTDMRYSEDGKENYDLVQQCITGEIEPSREDPDAGSLMIFKGIQSLHRVTDVQDGERILITFNFKEKPGIPLSEQSRMTFFGRTE